MTTIAPASKAIALALEAGSISGAPIAAIAAHCMPMPNKAKANIFFNLIPPPSLYYAMQPLPGSMRFRNPGSSTGPGDRWMLHAL
jgi:hypothetical protein